MKKITIGIVGGLLASSLMSASAMSVASNMSMSFGLGAMNDEVVTLQTFLETQGYLRMPSGVAKGYFGDLTKRALMEYQRAEGLPSTGYFGQMTRAKWAASSKNDVMMNGDGVMVGGALMIRTRDIVDNALLANNVTTVVAAVKAAGLVETLKSAGPFTVFAPNNKAFAALPAGTVETLIKPENKAKLVDILTYHVVSGRYKVADLTDGLMLTTVQGKTLKITKVNGQVTINGSAMIETSDVISSNGVTHVITSVLLP